MTPSFIRARATKKLGRAGAAGRGARRRMPPAKSLPVSRDLARIIRESSRLEPASAPLADHVRAVEDRQTKALEFYLRACAMRLG